MLAEPSKSSIEDRVLALEAVCREAADLAHETSSLVNDNDRCWRFIDCICKLAGLQMQREIFPLTEKAVIQLANLCGLICSKYTIRTLVTCQLVEPPPREQDPRKPSLWEPRHAAQVLASLISRKRFHMMHPLWMPLKSRADLELELHLSGRPQPGVEEVAKMPLGLVVDAVMAAETPAERAAACAALKLALAVRGIDREDDAPAPPTSPAASSPSTNDNE